MSKETPHKELIVRINAAIRQAKYFRNINLTRATFAKELGIGETQLSRVINEEMQTDFHELLNTQRARYARHVLQMECHKNETLDEIAFFCGFKSRITFYRYFSSLYGISPGEFRIKC